MGQSENTCQIFSDSLATRLAARTSVRGAADPLRYTGLAKCCVMVRSASSISSVVICSVCCKCRQHAGALRRKPRSMHADLHKLAPSFPCAAAASGRRARHARCRQQRRMLRRTAALTPTSTFTACARRARAGRKTIAAMWRVAKGYGRRRSVDFVHCEYTPHARDLRRKSSPWAWRARGVRLPAPYGLQPSARDAPEDGAREAQGQTAGLPSYGCSLRDVCEA